jgi:fused signal recognition particle receptor
MSEDKNTSKPGFLGRLFGRGGAAPADASASAPAPDPVVVEAAVEPTPRRSWWQRLRAGLSRSSSALSQGITDIFTKRKLDAATLEDLEDMLIRADLGVATSARITEAVGQGALRQGASIPTR